MALRKQPLALQFAGGIETKQDSKQVPTAQLLNLENATFIKKTTLAKRNGYRALSKQVDNGAGEYGTATGLGKRDDELLVFAGGHAYSYRAAADRWSDSGVVSSVVATMAPIARTGTQQTNPDHATLNGITVIAYVDATFGGVWCTVVDATSKRELLPPTLLHGTAERPRCVVVDQVMLVLFAVAASGRLYSTIINPALPSTAPVAAILTEDLDIANPVYDAESYAGANKTEAAIVWSIGALGYRLGNIAATGALGSPVNGYPSVATFADLVTGPIALGIGATWSQVAVAWNGTTAADFRFHSLTTFASLYAGFTGFNSAWIRASVAMDGTSSGWFAFEASGASLDLNSVTTIHVSASIGIGASGQLRGHGLGARLFVDGGHTYVTVTRNTFFFPYVAIVAIPDGSGGWGIPATGLPPPAARVLAGQSTGLPSWSHLPSVVANGRQYTIALGYRIQLSSANGDQFGERGIQLATLDFASNAAWLSTQLGRGLTLAGACQLHYDGYRWAELGFHCAPDTATGVIATAPAAGGAMTPAGAYLYLYCYEEIDGNGEVHQGPTTAGTRVIMGGADTQVTHTIPTYMLTSRRHTRIGVYRSLFNAIGTIDQIPFYRVTSTDPSAAGANGYVTNNVGADTVTFIDRMSDAVLATKEPLYTNGGIISNDPPPSKGSALAGGKSRLFWTDPSDPHVARFSQQLQDETAPEPAARLSLRTDPYGGDIVGIGVMDDAVYLLAETAIYMFGGPGPLPNPDIGDASFTPAALLTSDVGCKSPGSICQSPIGIAFQSQKGIKLLGRDRQVIDIGAPVYAYNSQTIVRATLLEDRNEIVFLTDAGKTLLYNYEHQQWSVFTNHEGLDAVVVGGRYYYLRTDGRVFVETPGLYRDDNLHVKMKIETAWIKMAGYLQGWQRIIDAMIIGAYKSSHQLGVRYRLDYQEAYSPLIVINVDANYNPSLYGAGLYGAGPYGGAGGPSTVYQQQIHLNQRCQAVSFSFEDIEATDTYGAAFELSELLLTGGVLGPKFQPGAARSS